jgi:dTDP-4-amino-4,6-dideoxygalactose transaminase
MLKRVKDILKSGRYVNGVYTYKLTKELEKRFNKKALLLDSGTSALILALRLLNCENKAVLLPSFCCSALLHASLMVGAKPVPYDIEYPSFYFNVKAIKNMTPKNLGAVIVVHPFGRATNIEEFINEFGTTKVVEDCATAFYTQRKNISCGSWSNFAVFSFGPTKYIASIKGGAILIKKESDFKRANDLFYYDKKDSLTLRYNFLSNEVSNLVTYSQVIDIENLCNRYKKVYNYYLEKAGKFIEYVNNDECENNFFKFIVLTAKKDYLKSFMRKSSIEVNEPVYIPIHRMLKLDKNKFKGSEEFYKKSLLLPSFTSIKRHQLNMVIDVLQKVFCKV